MKYQVTPLCLTDAILMADPMAMLARGGRHTVQAISSYEERPAIEADVEDAHAACERAWGAYQNLDEDQQCPDGGRSLMVGDMTRVEAGEDTTWWICCSVGWEQTVAPSEEAQRIEA